MLREESRAQLGFDLGSSGGESQVQSQFFWRNKHPESHQIPL